MCGIAGVLSYAKRSDNELLEPLPAMSAAMARRGPDDCGDFTDGAHCAMTFRRLAILDLSRAGHQPMQTLDGRYSLVYNGEVYNYRELRESLIRDGVHPRSTGDTETVLLSLQRRGAQALADFNGMFALALYDRDKRSLLLARDHVGIKPLYYAETSQGIVFGSQYDQLLLHPWLRDARPDPAAVGLYLRFGFIPAPYALHTGIRQLEPGSWRSFSVGEPPSSGRYYELPQQGTATLIGENAVDAFDQAFSAAVRRHLTSDVPVGVFLSGGIDSPLVAAEARTQLGARLPAFTIGVEDPVLSEVEDAARYAEALDLEHVVRVAAADDALASIDDVIDACSEPTADYSMFPTLLVSKVARTRVKVVLSGDGGDELFWGYPSRFAKAIEQGPYFSWPRATRYMAIMARKTLGYGTATRDVVSHSSVGRLYQRKHTLLDERDLAAVFPHLPPLPASFDAFDFDGTSHDSIAQWTRWNELRIHLARVLQKVDRASMYHSLEVRVPLLDREVIDVAWRTDWRTCLDLEGREGKRVLRRALRRRTTYESKGKRGFSIPMYEWLCGPLRGLVEDTLLSSDELLGVAVESNKLQSIAQSMWSGDRTKAWGIWSLLALTLWHRRKRIAR